MEEIFTNSFAVSLLCGVIFLIAAMVTYCFPPKKINPLYGYRTASSMKSQERWDFAQRYSTMQMIKGASVMVVISLLGYFVPVSPDVKFWIGIALLAAMVFYLFKGTEKAIKEKFETM
ncbi:SdpI family protein [Flavobacterium sp.]|uniref:SdpI family protein n=1 Tax=Flavobacterium sp. TaxID=239 RepID=UPI0040345FC6